MGASSKAGTIVAGPRRKPLQNFASCHCLDPGARKSMYETVCISNRSPTRHAGDFIHHGNWNSILCLMLPAQGWQTSSTLSSLQLATPLLVLPTCCSFIGPSPYRLALLNWWQKCRGSSRTNKSAIAASVAGLAALLRSGVRKVPLCRRETPSVDQRRAF